jgi:hypothetical protein
VQEADPAKIKPEDGPTAEKIAQKVVGNGFISLMAYQSKGYAYIAP